MPIVIKGERTKKGSVTTSNRRKKERRKKWTDGAFFIAGALLNENDETKVD